MLVICPIFDRIELLPFYLRHYTNLGATQFVFAVWNGETNPLWHRIDDWKFDYPIELRKSVECPIESYNGPSETVGLNRMREEFRKTHDWFCVADLDEFCWFKDGASMRAVAGEADMAGFSSVHGFFHDRFARDLSFPAIDPSKTLDEQFPLRADATGWHGANTNKVCLARTNVPILSGHHGATGAIWMNQIEVHHFKWTQGVEARLQERFKHLTGQGVHWAYESGSFLKAIAEGKFRPDTECNWQEARKIGI